MICLCGSLVTLQLYNRAQPHVSVATGASGGTRLVWGTQVNEPLVCFSTEKAIRDMKPICLQLERSPKSRHPLSFLLFFPSLSRSLPFPSCTFYLHSFICFFFFSSREPSSNVPGTQWRPVVPSRGSLKI